MPSPPSASASLRLCALSKCADRASDNTGGTQLTSHAEGPRSIAVMYKSLLMGSTADGKVSIAARACLHFFCRPACLLAFPSSFPPLLLFPPSSLSVSLSPRAYSHVGFKRPSTRMSFRHRQIRSIRALDATCSFDRKVGGVGESLDSCNAFL